jgi:hypothetical protein
VVRQFADRLRAKDQPTGVILDAVMRNLIHLANGVMKNRTPFGPADAA